MRESTLILILAILLIASIAINVYFLSSKNLTEIDVTPLLKENEILSNQIREYDEILSNLNNEKVSNQKNYKIISNYKDWFKVIE